MPGSGRRLQLVPPTGKKPAWARCGETTSAEWILFLHSTDWLDFSLLVRDAFGLILNSGLQAGGPKAPDGKKGRVGAGGSPVKPKVEEATASDGSVEDKGQKKGKGKSTKPPVEPPKDYVHVRARRGQATDSHSLAERVRREKISQRMKFLQDLVPGCNKVVGKALMLDEIINYVQSLQQQVEFLSMKLATVNPQLDFSNLSTLLHKDVSL